MRLPSQVWLTRVTKWSWLKASAMGVDKRRDLKKAIVALARRVAAIMHRMWIDGAEFHWTKEKTSHTLRNSSESNVEQGLLKFR
jgi:transposase